MSFSIFPINPLKLCVHAKVNPCSGNLAGVHFPFQREPNGKIHIDRLLDIAPEAQANAFQNMVFVVGVAQDSTIIEKAIDGGCPFPVQGDGVICAEGHASVATEISRL